MMSDSEVFSVIERLLGSSGSVELDMADPQLGEVARLLPKAHTRLALSNKGIVVSFPQSGGSRVRIERVSNMIRRNTKASSASAFSGKEDPIPIKEDKEAKEPKSLPPVKRYQHTYVPPKIAGDLISVLKDDASHIAWLVGPTQCGKSTLVKYVGRELGRKVFQINCRGDMGSEIFFGEKTVAIDEQTKQNHIVFQKGIIEQAMTEGLDEQGNEVGAPGILFIDEVSACPAHVAHGLNRLFESDDPKRTIVIAEDGGRVVRSHSGFRIVLAANTVGRGATDMSTAMYAAQHDALDISLLNRVAVFFRMGYDKEVERHILVEKIGDDKLVKLVLKFRDAIRQHIREGKLTSPFSTAQLVHIADMYRVFNDIGKAIYYVVFESILPEERPIYNEQAMVILGIDLLQTYVQNNVDYM